MKSEIYMSVDVETAGSIPGKFSMLSIGACLIDDTTKTFYAEIKPTNKYIQIGVPNFVRDLFLKVERSGLKPRIAMSAFEDWIRLHANGGRPVFVGFNATFDWQFTNYYFVKFLGRNPFGISGLDIKAYYMGKFGTSWSETSKSRIPDFLKSNKRHTHNALDDAIEQAELFNNIANTKL
ncbi:MAG: 3'-5' exoribonuclease [DPANN group archaeon]|nr:3'-5' exoribonuclease [DPANN group archaeon]